MRRIVLFAITALLVTSSAYAQRGAPQPMPLEPGASQADVDKAVMAAPEGQQAAAGVIKWNAADNFSYTWLRHSGNQLVCFDKSGLPGQLPFSTECSHEGNIERAQQNMRFEAMPDRDARQAAIAAAENAGDRALPVYGSVWYHYQGQDMAGARRHHTIAVPNGTAASTGFPDNPQGGGVWLMNAGTPTAHLMIPGE